MSPGELVLLSWRFEFVPAAGIFLSAILYWRGWMRLRHTLPARFPAWRAVSFLAGLGAIGLALFSPLDAFAAWLLSVHMVQHLLLTMVAAPLVLLGCPFLPILSGLPKAFVARGLGPFFHDPVLIRVAAVAVHPVFAGSLFMLSNVVWHVPAFYEAALASTTVHQFEHLCFLGTAILFWWPVVQPWPSRAVWPRWAMIPYLLAADLQNTMLSGFFAFYGQIVYPSYAAAPRVSSLDALSDQVLAGAIMWVPGSIAFLLPTALIAIQYLGGNLQRPGRIPNRRLPAPLQVVRPSWRPLPVAQIRRAAQWTMLAIAGWVVWDGFRGPQVAAMNLAGVLPWTHWRGFSILALLVFGNIFCMACPFTLVRDAGRKVLKARRIWPKRLQNKWTAAGLLFVFLWAYEFYDLWATPAWTAWIILFYFGTAFVIDGIFRGASFCQAVCPIGQFHFLSSLVSPVEVGVKDSSLCASCQTHDCLRGNDTRRGCELHLFQPSKSGNMDCTFCLDCVAACPSSNVGFRWANPARDLLTSSPRSVVGSWGQRPDIALIGLVFTAGAFSAAAGMTAPVVEWQEHFLATMDFLPLWMANLTLFALATLALPLGATLLASAVSVRASQVPREWCERSILLIPLGVSMWAAHLLFHLSTAFFTPWPVLQRVGNEAGWWTMNPDWMVATPHGPWLIAMQILCLNAGFLGSLWLFWKKSHSRPSRPFFSWALMALLSYVLGVWICLQPMEMRGAFF